MFNPICRARANDISDMACIVPGLLPKIGIKNRNTEMAIFFLVIPNISNNICVDITKGLLDIGWYRPRQSSIRARMSVKTRYER